MAYELVVKLWLSLYANKNTKGSDIKRQLALKVFVSQSASKLLTIVNREGWL